MEKKVTLLVLGVLVVALGAAVMGYNAYLAKAPAIAPDNTAGGTSTQEPDQSQNQMQTETPSVQVEQSGFSAEAENGGGTFSICVDACGNGVCDEGVKECTNLNCICRETPQECPQDCTAK